MKFKINKYRYNNKKNILNYKIFIFSSVLILFFLSIIILSIVIVKKNINNFNDKNIEKSSYISLFNDGNYTELIKNLDIILKKDPFNQKLLVYRGYSYFLLAEDEESVNNKKNYLTSALFDLRKSMAIGVPTKNLKNIYFILGKIYFYLGDSYYKQSLKYLNKSLEDGNKRNDLLYILGLLYSHLGDYKKSIEVFQSALKNDNSEILILALANSYVMNEDYENALKYIDILINNSDDLKIKEKCYLLKGEILYNENKYTEALNYFDKIIDINENNAIAYFYRGEIYYKKNNLVKARAEWRKTLQIDPSHVKANKRLYL